LKRLLANDEAAAVGCERDGAPSAYVVVCDHAGQRIPRALNQLGLAEADLQRHIAWDIGALGVARKLSAELDATVVWQNYSRLVIDCNRPLSSAALIIECSEATDIPGNQNPEVGARALRIQEVYTPYHDAITRVLDAHEAAHLASIFVSVHSFTPVYLGQSRPWQLGLLFGDDARLGNALLKCVRADGDLCVGENEPYRIDGKDQTLPEHALRRGFANILFEIRQDLIATPAAQAQWGSRLANLLRRAVGSLELER
jgi:predicted N-formylglutamate amidohydrolase